MRFGKIWGITRPIIQKPLIELHEINIRKGGYCSRHCHRAKYNLFYVIKGELVIRTWKNDYNLVDETVLTAGQSTIQRPGEDHQFFARTDVHCLELYYVELDPHDIKRADVGGQTDAFSQDKRWKKQGKIQKSKRPRVHR